MPSSTLFHALAFVAGAALGGGIATAIVANANNERRIISSRPVPPAGKPIVEVGIARESAGGGRPTFDLRAAAEESPVLRYGHPGPVSDLMLRKAYVAAYDRRLRHPAWAAEHLTASSLGRTPGKKPNGDEDGDRSRSKFVEDDSLPVQFRARLQDYFRSGYDRGHLAPAADAKASQEAMDETFILSNIAPQVGIGFNRHYWAYMEDWCRRLTDAFADVYVFTVPLYLPTQEADGKWRVTHEVIGSPPNIAVPTHFAKVLLASKPSSPSTPTIPDLSVGAFVFPNAAIPEETPLESFVVPVEAVEKAAGLSIFSEEVKKTAKHICQTFECQLMVRRFDDAQKGLDRRRTISGPR